MLMFTTDLTSVTSILSRHKVRCILIGTRRRPGEFRPGFGMRKRVDWPNPSEPLARNLMIEPSSTESQITQIHMAIEDMQIVVFQVTHRNVLREMETEGASVDKPGRK